MLTKAASIAAAVHCHQSPARNSQERARWRQIRWPCLVGRPPWHFRPRPGTLRLAQNCTTLACSESYRARSNWCLDLSLSSLAAQTHLPLARRLPFLQPTPAPACMMALYKLLGTIWCDDLAYCVQLYPSSPILMLRYASSSPVAVPA